MEGEPEQPILRDALMDLGHHHRDAPRAVGGIDAHDAPAPALGHPEVTVRPPCDLPRGVEPLGHDAHREPFGWGAALRTQVCCSADRREPRGDGRQRPPGAAEGAGRRAWRHQGT